MMYAKPARIALTVIGGLLYGAGSVRAEDSGLTFEVAAVRVSAPDTRSTIQGGPGTSDPGQIAWISCSADFLIERAYGIERDQLSGPSWLTSARYDISAKVPPGTTPEQFSEMLRNLLFERFHLEVHHKTLIVPAYDLVLGKGPLKLKLSEWVPPPPPADSVPSHRIMETVPVFSTGRDGNWTVTGRGARISDLVKLLRIALQQRVEDRTGLTDKYDFTFEYSKGTQGTAPYIVDSVREQLGLDLKSTRITLDGVVVDRMDPTPTEN